MKATKEAGRKKARTSGLRPVAGLAVRGAACLALALVLLTTGELVSRPVWAAACAGLLGLQAVCDLSICLTRWLTLNLVRKPIAPHHSISLPASPIRESWRFLPRWLQPLLTQLSGKPLVGEATKTTSPIGLLARTAAKLIVGVILTCIAAYAEGIWWALALPGLVLTTHVFRLLALGVFHQCAHGTFTGKPHLDAWIGETVGVLLLGQNFASYLREHPSDHHGSGFMSERDPTIAFLWRILALDLGMSRLECWVRLLATIVSPLYHVAQTARRLRASWMGASRFHRGVLIMYVLALAGLAAGWPVVVLVAWLLPLVVFTNVSLAIRACFEHCYPPTSVGRLHSPAGVAACTHAVFFGAMIPADDRPWPRRWLGYLGWTVQMVVYHAVARALFCPGESPAHDFHHRHPRAGLRPDPLFARQAALGTCGNGQAGYTEVWSLHVAIDECFRTIQERAAFISSISRKEPV